LAQRRRAVEDAGLMRVLVTGHRGYVGSVLVPELIAAGHDVHGVDACFFETSAIGVTRAPIDERRKDIRDIEARELEGFDAVVHLAALSNDPLGDLSAALTEEINHEATVRLARLAREAAVPRFIFSSSCSVYGAAGEGLMDESSECRPVTAYARSKLAAEVDVAKLADSRFSPVFLRHATAYGASAQLRFDLALNNIVAWAASTERIYIKSDGRAWRPFIHVEDIATAFVAVLGQDAATTHNQILNVGDTAENYRVLELAELVRAELPEARLEHAADAFSDRRCYRVDCGKIRRLVPRFVARWKVPAGIHEVAELCRRARWQPQEFEGPRYARVEHLKALLEQGVLGSDLRRRQGDEKHAEG
jgi:nucleoside-diphosphate-sugar epimerase